MDKNYKRSDSTKRSILTSNKDFFELVGQEIGKPKEFKAYRDLFDKSTADSKQYQNYPVHIDFELNFICNIKCTFCIQSLDNKKIKEWGDKKQHISFETFKLIIDDGVKNGLRSVAFNGTNEPLTIKDLDKYIRYAKDSGILDIMFNSNGLLLTKDISRKLIDSGLTRIMISVDAFSKEGYEKQRIGGDYDKLVKNILDFIELRNSMGAKLPLIRLSFLAHAHNIHEIEPFLEFWRDKVDFFALQSLRDAFLLDEEKSNEFREYFDIDTEKIEEFFNCPQPFVRVMVRNNGDVIPCCSFYGMKLPIGNIYNQSIYEIYNGEKMQEIRRVVNSKEEQPEACRMCRSGSTVNYDLSKYINKV